jgi:5'-methylthioadenosine phosphorylase
LQLATERSGGRVHAGGAFIVIEGPAFSTRAESLLYQTWGGTVIGMTAIPEAKLAREAGMCYSCLACVTDYDTWHEGHARVSVELILKNLLRNAGVAKESVAALTSVLPDWRTCDCCASLRQALVTDPTLVPGELRQDLAPILERYGPRA